MLKELFGAAEMKDWLLALPFGIANVSVIAVWVFTYFNEWFLYTRISNPVYTVVILGGFSLSFLIFLISHFDNDNKNPLSLFWLNFFRLNLIALIVNFMGFVAYIAPGC